MLKACAVLIGVLVGAGCNQGLDENVEVLYERAVAGQRAGRFAESERILMDLLENEPGTLGPQAEVMLETVRATQESEVIQVLEAIRQAQADFMNQERRFAQFFDELVVRSLLPVAPGELDLGYEIQMRGRPAADGYRLTAEPIEGRSAKRFLFSDETGAIRWAIGEPATQQSPELGSEGPGAFIRVSPDPVLPS